MSPITPVVVIVDNTQ